jgi:hypothetical protein
MPKIAMNEAYTPELRGRMYAELATYLYPKRKAVELAADPVATPQSKLVVEFVRAAPQVAPSDAPENFSQPLEGPRPVDEAHQHEDSRQANSDSKKQLPSVPDYHYPHHDGSGQHPDDGVFHVWVHRASQSEVFSSSSL